MQSTVYTQYQTVRQQYILANIQVIQRADGFTPCWEWNRLNDLGYGVSNGGKRGDGSYGKAYRASYLAFVGPIPARLQIDHLCCNHACVNPAHLEPVTQRVNVQRAVVQHRAAGTGNWNRLEVCSRGLHAMTDDNIQTQMVRGYPKRLCRECGRERQRQFHRNHPEKAAEYAANKRSKLHKAA